jgi:hypothetical protein
LQPERHLAVKRVEDPVTQRREGWGKGQHLLVPWSWTKCHWHAQTKQSRIEQLPSLEQELTQAAKKATHALREALHQEEEGGEVGYDSIAS